jgi:hypothetical protein
MTEELELQLVAKYPKILRDYGGDEMVTCMHWGFSHNDGWYKLLDEWMARLQYFCDLSGCQLIADQIKEKTGDLCFYYHIENNNIEKNEKFNSSIIRTILIEMQESASKICENTGDFGCLCVKGGWFKTLSHTEGRKFGYEPVSKYNQEGWKYVDSKMVKVPKSDE